MKKAFSLIELVFIILLIGIISSIVIPSTKTNSLQEAAIQLASDLRYSQHLAMVNDIYTKNDKYWFRMRWVLLFSKHKQSAKKIAYTVFSDTSGKHTGYPQITEIALNPLNNKQLMTGGHSGANVLDIRKEKIFLGMKDLNLGLKYGITKKSFKEGCSKGRITFDFLGRPMTGSHRNKKLPYEQKLITKKCKIILSNKENENILLLIEPETGQIEIVY